MLLQIPELIGNGKQQKEMLTAADCFKNTNLAEAQTDSCFEILAVVFEAAAARSCTVTVKDRALQGAQRDTDARVQ